MQYTVVISGRNFGEHPMPGWNEAIAATGRHPMKGGSMKKAYMAVAINAIRRQLPRGLHIEKPITLHYKFYEPHGRRDPGNCLYADKVFEDALQICHVIENDGQKQIYGISTGKVEIDKANPRVEITITEVE